MAHILDDLQNRGLIAQRTAEAPLHDHLGQCRTLYCGFDPTADSLHIGSLVPLLALRRFQQHGHKPLVLVGGATGLIGDPSFKAEERKLNTPDVVAGWVEKLKAQTSQFVDFDSGTNAAEVVNNLDWTHDISVLDFLRDTGKHFAVNAMIQKESVKQRIEREGEGISFTEFSYMILQSMDFAELYSRYGCTLQLGGSDQWGNITGGIELSRRIHRAQTFGLTLPLVTKADGSKFGKTESGTIWLDASKTSPYSFYQFWINTADADVYKFLNYFSFRSVEDIQAIQVADESAQGARQAQQTLASDVTELVHGAGGLAAAQRISSALFAGSIDELTASDFAQLALDGLPCFQVEGGEKPLLQALVDTGLSATPRGEVTLGQARKFVAGNAVAVNGEKVGDVDAVLLRSEARFGKYHLLKRGKKLFALLEWV